MSNRKRLCSCLMLRIAAVAGGLWLGGPVSAEPDLVEPYQPIDPTMSDTTITLT
jgi:hypothetical protein